MSMPWRRAFLTTAIVATGLAVVVFARAPVMAPLAIGLTLSTHGWLRRRGSMLVCAVCGYETSPVRVPRCSECGSNWEAEHGLRRGVPARSWWMIATGLLVMLSAPAAHRLRDDVNLVALRLTPTRMLVHDAERRRLGYAESCELARREIGGELADRLAKASHLQDPSWIFRWLANTLTDGTVSPPVRDEIFALHASKWRIEPPSPCSPTTGSIVTLIGVPTMDDAVRHYPHALAWIVGDVRVSGPGVIVPAGQEPPPWRSPAYNASILTAVQSTARGPIRVEFTVWFAAFAGNTPPERVDWTETREPVTDASWIWVKPRTITVTIEPPRSVSG